jgi:uncharacterized iron-regulated membrane protein
MTPVSLRRWAWVHTWSSLVCTVFMLLLCLTGLPLIFHHEIEHLLGDAIEAPAMPAGTPRASLDRVIEVAKARQPGKVVQFVSREEDDDTLWYVTLNDEPMATENFKSVVVDARTAEVLGEPKLGEGFMNLMFRLHVDLFAGLPGKLFLGLMGLLLVAAIVSGVVLYAPFMRKLDFGTVRVDRSTRVRWLDLHNLLGIVTVTWALVVGFTGVINTWADLMVKFYQYKELGAMTAQYKGQPTPKVLGSLQQSAERAQGLEPDMTLAFVAFPGTSFSSPHHYAIFMRGHEPLTSRLVKPVLADAVTSQITDSRELPWYLKALLVSQPLHFGDYGGMPLKVVWALLDIATIVVLGSGLYLWIARKRAASRAVASQDLLNANDATGAAR